MNTPSDSTRFRQTCLIVAGFVVLLWAIKIFEWISGTSLHQHGIYPRDSARLYGVLFAPLLHGSFAHLFTNSCALLVLGTSALYGYPRAARIMLPLIYLGSGLGVWFYGRASLHFGASGLTFGLMFFMFTLGALRWDRRASALSMLVFFLYGGMIWGVFPTRPEVSFEYHLFGALIGIFGAFVLRDLDPAAAMKKYSWEEEPELDDDPYWLRSGDMSSSEQPPHRASKSET